MALLMELSKTVRSNLISKEEFLTRVPPYVVTRELLDLVDRMTWPIPAPIPEQTATVDRSA